MSGIILCAGGIGSRIQSPVPKQFLLLNDKPFALHCFDVFASMQEISEIVVVCSLEYQHLFTHPSIKVTFALPGKRRQDSVYNGFQAMALPHAYIGVHDAARPFISVPLVQRTISAAHQYGAAAPGVPIKYTLKESNGEGLVIHTPNRSSLWEIQTPQVIEYSALKKGFMHAYEHHLTVTDDVSLVENLGLPVKIVEGCYRNLKITTIEDLLIAQILTQHMDLNRIEKG